MVEELAFRVERLEAELVEVRRAWAETRSAQEQGGTAGAAASPAALPAEVVLAISAAVAAYLGKRAVVKQIHFAGDTAWAQQGRAAVQSSHFVHGVR
ncbi:MAG: hypothetical protein GXX79_22425 [Actinomycetales bacterium]|nr:hypothetical protein [Actinomycetales bacterium]